jgi:hypothetical protein
MMFRPVAAVNNVQVPGDRPSIGRRAVRAFTRFVLTACIGGAGVAWQFYGDAAKRTIASWAPHLVLTSSPPLQNLAPSEQPSPPTVQAVDVNAAPRQPAAAAQTAPKGVAPNAPAQSPDSAQLLQSMARDLASVGQEIEQLKASQQQMSRDVAKRSEQNRRPRISAPPPRLAAAQRRGAHADRDARDHALPLDASGRWEVSGRRFDFHEKAAGQIRVIERHKLAPKGQRDRFLRSDATRTPGTTL